MREDEATTVPLPTQLEALQRERVRLEELLTLDANWRALRQLEVAAGAPADATQGPDVKVRLVEALSENPIFVARSRLMEAIERLSVGASLQVQPGDLVSQAAQVVTLNAPEGERFRARLRVKAVEPMLVSPSELPREPDCDAASSAEPVSVVVVDERGHKRGGGYVRPEHQRLDAKGMLGARSAGAGFGPLRSERRVSLGDRLKALRMAERFSAAGYAAYRSTVEEASVMIVTGDRAPSAKDDATSSHAGESDAGASRPPPLPTGEG